MLYMKIKQFIFITSFFATLGMWVGRKAVLLGICEATDYSCRVTFDLSERILMFAPFVLFFSILTYKMSEQVFTAWWKFAKYAIPTVLLLSTVINLELHHSPAGQMQGMFDAPALGLLYFIFTFGSIIQVVRAYRNS